MGTGQTLMLAMVCKTGCPVCLQLLCKVAQWRMVSKYRLPALLVLQPKLNRDQTLLCCNKMLEVPMLPTDQQALKAQLGAKHLQDRDQTVSYHSKLGELHMLLVHWAVNCKAARLQPNKQQMPGQEESQVSKVSKVTRPMQRTRFSPQGLMSWQKLHTG